MQWANRVAVTISTSSTTATATTIEPRQYTPYTNIVYTRHGQSLRGDNDPIQLLLAYMKREYSGLLTALGRQRPKGKKEKQRLKREHVKQDVCYLSIRRTRIRIAPRGVYSVSSDVYIYTKAYRIVLYCTMLSCLIQSHIDMSSSSTLQFKVLARTRTGRVSRVHRHIFHPRTVEEPIDLKTRL